MTLSNDLTLTYIIYLI